MRSAYMAAGIGALLSSSFAGSAPRSAPDDPEVGVATAALTAAAALTVAEEELLAGSEALPEVAPWVAALYPLRFVETRSHAETTVSLYHPDGSFDDDAAVEVDRVALAEVLAAPTVLAALPSRTPPNVRPAAPPPQLDRRLLRLLVKVAAHFHATEIDLVSTFRDGARPGSRHRLGEAADFSLPGVTPAKLAAHLRGYARVGVGVYTNRRTQFVHLDVRAESYHWADASPPGVSWRESRMTDRAAPLRDAAWTQEQDLP